MNKHQTGNVSELLAAQFFIKNGYSISLPFDNFGEYDLIIDNGVLSRVQVKTIYWDTNKQRHLISCVTSHIRGNLRRTNKKYTQTSFDFLLGVEILSHTYYLIPVDQLQNRRSITVYPNGKPLTVNNRYGDFETYKCK